MSSDKIIHLQVKEFFKSDNNIQRYGITRVLTNTRPLASDSVPECVSDAVCMLRVVIRCCRLLLTRPRRPQASEVLTSHLRQAGLPHWTAFCVRYSAIENDQFGQSHFNWAVDGVNYHVLRTGAFPYVKYHCSARPLEDLTWEDTLYTWIKIFNLGVPTLVYGLGMFLLVSHKEQVQTSKGTVPIYFWYEENRRSLH